MKSARTPIAGVAAGPFPLAMPSRLVTPRVPCVPPKISTLKEEAEVKPKYPGRVLMVNCCALGAVTDAVKRDQRRVTTSTPLAEAGVAPLAAVKVGTCTATVWPSLRKLVFVPLVKSP